MKKLVLFSIAAMLFSGVAFAQKNNKNKYKKNDRVEREHKWKHSEDNDDQGEDGRYKKHRKNKTGVYNNSNGKYSKNQPAKVRAAFERDFPNATNVTWTKDRGYWTAHFNGGIFGGSNTATYKANGERVTDTSGIFGPRKTTKKKGQIF